MLRPEPKPCHQRRRQHDEDYAQILHHRNKERIGPELLRHGNHGRCCAGGGPPCGGRAGKTAEPHEQPPDERAGCNGSKDGGSHEGPALKDRGQKRSGDGAGDQAADQRLPRNERAPWQADRRTSEGTEDADQHWSDEERCRDGKSVQRKGEGQRGTNRQSPLCSERDRLQGVPSSVTILPAASTCPRNSLRSARRSRHRVPSSPLNESWHRESQMPSS